MFVWHVQVVPENLQLLTTMSRLRRVYDPNSERELLRLDLAVAMQRFGQDRRRIVEYLLPGRRHWGAKNMVGPTIDE
jgi:hypothetical protein